MLETPHVIVGAAIASQVIHPALAIPLALGSHFILETIPHWNPHLGTETKKYGRPTNQTTGIVIADASVALVAGSYLAYRALPNTALAVTILFACFASVVPDLVEAPYFFLGVKNNFIIRWIASQKKLQTNAGVAVGLTTQLLVIIAGLWWILS
jgi:hypothetical protein